MGLVLSSPKSFFIFSYFSLKLLDVFSCLTISNKAIAKLLDLEERPAITSPLRSRFLELSNNSPTRIIFSFILSFLTSSTMC